MSSMVEIGAAFCTRIPLPCCMDSVTSSILFPDNGATRQCTNIIPGTHHQTLGSSSDPLQHAIQVLLKRAMHKHTGHSLSSYLAMKQQNNSLTNAPCTRTDLQNLICVHMIVVKVEAEIFHNFKAFCCHKSLELLTEPCNIQEYTVFLCPSYNTRQPLHPDFKSSHLLLGAFLLLGMHRPVV